MAGIFVDCLSCGEDIVETGIDMRKHAIYISEYIPSQRCTNYPPPVDNHTLGNTFKTCVTYSLASLYLFIEK